MPSPSSPHSATHIAAALIGHDAQRGALGQHGQQLGLGGAGGVVLGGGHCRRWKDTVKEQLVTRLLLRHQTTLLMRHAIESHP